MRPEQNAVGIYEPDVAVGPQGAQNGGRVGAHDSIEDDGSGTGLEKPDRLIGIDGEALPVDNRFLGKLLNLSLGAGGKVDLSASHGRARWICRRCVEEGHSQQRVSRPPAYFVANDTHC